MHQVMQRLDIFKLIFFAQVLKVLNFSIELIFLYLFHKRARHSDHSDLTECFSYDIFYCSSRLRTWYSAGTVL